MSDVEQVGNVLKVFVPVQVLLNDCLTNVWAFSVVKLTNWFAEFADVAQVGNVLKVFVPVQVLIFARTNCDVVNSSLVNIV